MGREPNAPPSDDSVPASTTAPRGPRAARRGAGQREHATRGRLLEAAETLFAERGIDAVSMREIARASGSRNVIAGQYWFGDKAGLVGALLAKHTPEVEARRHALLDTCESSPHDLRALAAALVRPLGAKLDQGVSGAGYLRTVADLLTQPTPSVTEPLGTDSPQSSLLRWGRLLEAVLDPEVVVLHRRFLTMRFVAVELALRARSDRSEHALFLAHLIDVATGQLGAPLGAETRRLRDARPPRNEPAR